MVNLPTHIRFRRNCKLFLTLTHSSYSKWKDILHTLKVYKISAKEHQGLIAQPHMKYQFWKYCFGNIENMSH